MCENLPLKVLNDFVDDTLKMQRDSVAVDWKI